MTFDREELLQTLSAASRALAKNTAVPDYECFWFDDNHVFAYDGGLGIRLKLESEFANVSIPGKSLLSLLKTSSLQQVFLDISIEKSGEAPRAILQMGKSKVSLAVRGVDPPLKWDTPKGSTLKLTEAVFEALSQV